MKLPRKNYVNLIEKLYDKKQYDKILKYYDEACKRVDGESQYFSIDAYLIGVYIKRHIEKKYASILI